MRWQVCALCACTALPSPAEGADFKPCWRKLAFPPTFLQQRRRRPPTVGKLPKRNNENSSWALFNTQNKQLYSNYSTVIHIRRQWDTSELILALAGRLGLIRGFTIMEHLKHHHFFYRRYKTFFYQGRSTKKGMSNED